MRVASCWEGICKQILLILILHHVDSARNVMYLKTKSEKFFFTLGKSKYLHPGRIYVFVMGNSKNSNSALFSSIKAKHSNGKSETLLK